MATKKSGTNSQLTNFLSQPVSLGSLLVFLVILVVGMLVYKQTVVKPDINKIDAKVMQQFQARFGSAVPSDLPTASDVATYSPWPSASGLISGDKGCVIKCVMGGTGYKKCQTNCKSGTPTGYTPSN